MKLRWIAAVALGLLGLVARAEGPADRILVGGRVLTVDADDRVAEAIAIKDGRILAIGSTAEIERYAGTVTERIDLAGRTATPGLIDAHVHFSIGGIQRIEYIDLGYPNAKSIAEIVTHVAERRDSIGPDDWILGSGWDEGKLAERRQLVAADFDEASGSHPAWLAHTSGHYGTANSKALEIAGITKDTPDPPGGVIDRNVKGELTGVLKETAMALVTSRVPRATREKMREAIRGMAVEFNRECMTGAKDPGLGRTLEYEPEGALLTWHAYQDVLDEGRLTVRVFVLWESPRTVDEGRSFIHKIAPLGGLHDPPAPGRLVSGGIKMFADGSGAARTAWTWQDWNVDLTGVDAGNRGFPAFDPDIMRDLIILYHDAGLHVGTHAIGDRAIDWVVDSYAQALHRNPAKGRRHAVIHANLPTDRAIRAMAELQRKFDAGYPESSPTFLWWVGDIYAGNFGPERSLRLNPFATYLNNGMRWASASDYFVTPLPARYGMWSSIARQPLLGTHGGDPFGRAEAVDVRAALKSFTIWAAHQIFMDDITGSLEPGKRADIAVWDTDFYAAPASSIKDATCLMTIFDGEVVHRSDRFP